VESAAVRRLRDARRQADVALLTGLLAIVAGAALLRLVHVGAHLPGLVSPDEPTVMGRALGLLHGTIPRQWDWPTGAMELLAAAIGLVRVLTPWLSGAAPWLFGRVLFVVVSLAVIVLTSMVGAELADGRKDRRLVSLGGAALVAVSYLSVRLSRPIQPDHLQLCFILGSALCALAYDRRRNRAALV